MEEASSSAKEVFLQPLINHFDPYLKRLFSDSRLLLNENLEFEMLDRNGYQEPFNQSSVGTREQIAVITRPTFAGLLTYKGSLSPPVTLDDDLVYSDDNRFEIMKVHFQISIEISGCHTCMPTYFAC